MSNVVRPATRADSLRIAQLSGELGYPASEAEIARRLELLGGRHDHAVFVLETQARVEGFLHAELVHGITDGEHVEIAALVVDELARSRGLGSALLARAEAWARELGVARVALRSRSTRERAHAFYLRAGYRVVKSQLRFVRDLEPASPRSLDVR